MRSEELKDLKRTVENTMRFQDEHGGLVCCVRFLYEALIKLIEALGEEEKR